MEFIYRSLYMVLLIYIFVCLFIVLIMEDFVLMVDYIYGIFYQVFLNNVEVMVVDFLLFNYLMSVVYDVKCYCVYWIDFQ